MSTSLVIADLDRWGPAAAGAGLPDLAWSQNYCRRLALRQYENFPVVTWALPPELRQHFYNVYAFCRWADDLGDESGGGERALQLLGWWRGELDRCFAGQASHPVFVALLPTIQKFDIPRQPFADLISAFEQDQRVRDYASRAELLDYCMRSANPVGRIVLHLCGRTGDECVRWSDSICTGLQLANFWQDVARDFNIGRVYLPREDRLRHSYDDEQLRQRTSTPAFRSLLAEEVAWARGFLIAGRPLVARMPGRLRVDIDLFLRGGLLILDGIEQIDYRVWERRPVVSKTRLLLAGLRSWLGRE